MSAHTPGPWDLCRYGRIALEIQGGGKSLAVVNKVAEQVLERLNEFRVTGAEPYSRQDVAEHEAQVLEAGAGEAEANARLMLAAPEMLEVLGALVYWHDKDGRVDESWWEAARAAIAKAEGGGR